MNPSPKLGHADSALNIGLWVVAAASAASRSPVAPLREDRLRRIRTEQEVLVAEGGVEVGRLVTLRVSAASDLGAAAILAQLTKGARSMNGARSVLLMRLSPMLLCGLIEGGIIAGEGALMPPHETLERTAVMPMGVHAHLLTMAGADRRHALVELDKILRDDELGWARDLITYVRAGRLGVLMQD
ncbi:hypothetical protein Q4F19_13545 [Sphingomonas sp. BIUV-7]|uniref:Uncharacterized protein n=2 Tax=Sphingomonas natans TaxID=3063330 RepID=A0ABT8YAQ2_9SPHN|nr:hypothetical protein [Sphingomonas sp. BIUV-7]